MRVDPCTLSSAAFIGGCFAVSHAQILEVDLSAQPAGEQWQVLELSAGDGMYPRGQMKDQTGTSSTASAPAYSNLSSFTGSGYAHGADLVLDDVQLALPDATLSGVTFSIANLGVDGTYSGGDIRLEIAAAEGGFGKAEVLLSEVLSIDDLIPGFSLAPGEVRFIRVVGIESRGIELPLTCLVGLQFLEPGGADSIDVLGQAIFGAPSRGASTDGILRNQSVVTFGEPIANLGLQVEVLIADPLAAAVSDVPIPSNGVVLQTAVPALNSADDAVFAYRTVGRSFVYVGSDSEGRSIEVRETTSTSSYGALSINERGEIVYNVFFPRSGDRRGAYRVRPGETPATFLTAEPPALLTPSFRIDGDGGVTGTFNIAGDSGELLLARYPTDHPGQPPRILAKDAGLDPSSDIAFIVPGTLAVNSIGDALVRVALVAGGEELRLYAGDGSGFRTIAADRFADPASPFFEFLPLSAPSLNALGEVVFLARDEDGGDLIYAEDEHGLRLLADQTRLLAEGITFVHFQDLSLNDDGRFALIASSVVPDTSRGLWTASLNGDFAEVIRTPMTVQLADDETATISGINTGGAAMNELGTIAVIADVDITDARAILIRADLSSRPCSEADIADTVGTTDFFDVIEYLRRFDAADPRADVWPRQARDGAFDTIDIDTFIESVVRGCRESR